MNGFQKKEKKVVTVKSFYDTIVFSRNQYVFQAVFSYFRKNCINKIQWNACVRIS